jgi:hypothetical protein
VEKGEPDPRLKRDLRFTAERVLVIMRSNPTEKDWERFSKRFLSSVDCKTIFPKLPSMLRHYHKTWKDNQMIQLAEEAMKAGYNKILTDLARPTSTTRAQRWDYQLMSSTSTH